MVRTVIIPANRDVHISIPENYVGKPIEITYLALEELEQKIHKTMADFWNTISDESAEKLHRNSEQMRSEWDIYTV